MVGLVGVRFGIGNGKSCVAIPAPLARCIPDCRFWSRWDSDWILNEKMNYLVMISETTHYILTCMNGLTRGDKSTFSNCFQKLVLQTNCHLKPNN